MGTFLEILIFIGLLAAFFWFVMLKFILPFCTGAWIVIRRVTDAVLRPFITLRRWLTPKKKAIPTYQVSPYYQTTMPILTPAEKKRRRIASLGGRRAVARMLICIAFILFTVLVVAIQSYRTADNRFWEDLFYSIPVLSLIKLFGTDSFSVAVLAELILFNLLAGIFMGRLTYDNDDPHVTLQDVFSYSLLHNIKENLREIAETKNPDGTAQWMTTLVAIIYDIIFTFFCTCLLFWLPDNWYPSSDTLFGYLLGLADYLVAQMGAGGWIVVALLFLLAGYLAVAAFALLVREFTATIAFTLVPLVGVILLYGVLDAIAPLPMAFGFVLAMLASIWQGYYRGHVEGLYDDYCKTKRLEKKRSAIHFDPAETEPTPHAEETDITIE